MGLSNTITDKIVPVEAKRIIAIRDALISDDGEEAYHQLYQIATKVAADPYNVWKEIEETAANGW